MSDILTRLLLDTKDYDSKLGRAKKSSNDFASNIGGKAASAIGKFAAGIGIAMGGVEAFNKIINSSQLTGDAWNNTINACKSTVDAFFQSLSTGNWNAFNDGLLSTFNRMKEVAALKDTLDDAKLSMRFETKQFESEYVRLEGIIDDATKSQSERNDAFASMQALITDFRGKVEDTASGAADTLAKEMSVKFGRAFEIADIEKYIREVNNEFLNTETLQRLNKYKETLSLFDDGRSRSIAGYGGLVMTKEQFQAQNEELEKMRLLQQDNDESRKAMVAELEYIQELYRRIEEFRKRSLEKQNKITALNKTTTGGSGKSETPIAGSLAALNAEIALAQKAYANAATDSAREAAYKALEELENKKGLIELHARVKMPEVGDGKSGGLAALAGGVSYDFDASKLKGLVNKDNVKTTEDFASGLNSVANAISAINSITGEGAAAFLSWAGSVATASAQVVESIRSVVAAKSAETVASSGASAAATPVVGWLMVGGAIAAALAAIANIPKFAEGGVVGGSSFFGDKLLCRLNSGETVLTQKQTARALSMIEGNNVQVSGDVRLSGKDIYISLRNYMSSSGNKL